MTRHKMLAAVVVLMLLGGCAASPRPAAPIPERLVPIAVRCRPDVRPEPGYPDSDAALQAAPDIFGRVRLLLAGRLMRLARERELQAALAECRA